METLKTAFATIGILAVVAVSCFFAFNAMSPADESGEPNVIPSSDGSGSSSVGSYSDDVKAELQRFADQLNKGGTLYLNAPLSSYRVSTNYATSIGDTYSISPDSGTVKVVGLSLEFDHSEYSNSTHYTHHHIVPYHAITDVVYSVPNSSA